MAHRRRALIRVGALFRVLPWLGVACGGGLEPSSLPPPPEAVGHGEEADPAAPWLDTLDASTRVLAHLEGPALAWAWSLPALRTIVESATRCGVDLPTGVRSIDIAVGDPAELSIDVDGDLNLEHARCIFSADATAEGAVRYGSLVIVGRAGRGIRLVTPGALRAGTGVETSLRARWAAVEGRGTAIVARSPETSAGGLSMVWDEAAEASVGLEPALAGEVAKETNALFATLAADGALPGGFEAKAEGGELRVRWSTPLTPAILGALHDRVIDFAWVEGPSMKPTLWPGDLVAYVGSTAAPARGDVRSFQVDGKHGSFVGRIVGLAGERIRLVGPSLSIDGTYVASTLVEPVFTSDETETGSPEPPAELWREMLARRPHSILRSPRGFGAQDGQAFEIRVAPGHVLFLGDHRDNALDSRRLGAVPLDRVGWAARFTVLSLSPRESIRWDRMLRPID